MTLPRLACYMRVVHHDAKAKIVWLIDLDQGKSVTNDAEAVVRRLIAAYGTDHRFIYRDTMGQWDELGHNGSAFSRFIPNAQPAPAPVVVDLPLIRKADFFP